MVEANRNQFKSLRIEGWRQFDSVDIDLHPRLTVLTGANGAGKSSLIQLFSRHFGVDRHFLATPTWTSDGSFTYFTGLFESIWKRFKRERKNEYDIGSITYTNGVEGRLRVPQGGGAQYSVHIDSQQGVDGIHIDSHQAISNYQTVGNIPASLTTPANVFAAYNNEILTRYNGGHTGYSPFYRIKESIIAMAMFGEGNSRVQANPLLLKAYENFIASLRTILPETLGFIDLSVRPPEVVMVTKTGEFLIDASSGGVSMLIDLVYRLQLYSAFHDEFTVTIDEPENHLHPTMQRSLMRRLLQAFPRVQFIIATHSPFMVSSVRDSNVYVLRYRENPNRAHELDSASQALSRRVVSEKLDTVNKAGSANEILREVLGVSATIPEWVEDGLRSIVNNYRSRPISPAMLKDLRGELTSLGYDDLYPEALAELTVGK